MKKLTILIALLVYLPFCPMVGMTALTPEQRQAYLRGWLREHIKTNEGCDEVIDNLKAQWKQDFFQTKKDEFRAKVQASRDAMNQSLTELE